MAEQERCAYCGLTLGLWGVVPMVRVDGRLYHAMCWIVLEAPSAKAPIAPCGVN